MSDFYDVVLGRKSVRTYDGRSLTDEDRRTIEEYASSISDPFGIPVRFVFLNAEEHGLSSPVLSGEKQYVAGLVDKVPYADVAFGYAMEQLVLYAWSLGIGTVWIGGTMKRERFEEAAGLSEGQRMPCISPIGYPAAKRSIKESLMRKGVKADTRKALREISFDKDLSVPLDKCEDIGNVMELVRWAPSAVNKQPWRIVRDGSRYHFYEKHDKGFLSEAVGDMQKIDMGIALYHFVGGLKDEGLDAKVTIEEPAIKVPDDIEYIATATISEVVA